MLQPHPHTVCCVGAGMVGNSISKSRHRNTWRLCMWLCMGLVACVVSCLRLRLICYMCMFSLRFASASQSAWSGRRDSIAILMTSVGWDGHRSIAAPRIFLRTSATDVRRLFLSCTALAFRHFGGPTCRVLFSECVICCHCRHTHVRLPLRQARMCMLPFAGARCDV